MSEHTIKLTISLFFGTLSSAIIELLGGGDVNLKALIIFMIIDFVTGLIVAIFWGKSTKSENGGLSSKACWRGIIKKVCTLLIVVVSHQADILLNTDYIRNAIIIAFCISEVISICENAGEMGILPKSVQTIFEKVIDMLKVKARVPDTDSKNDEEK